MVESHPFTFSTIALLLLAMIVLPWLLRKFFL